VRLDPELARPVGQYSQGMRQRMSLARAILHDQKYFCWTSRFPTWMCIRRGRWWHCSRRCGMRAKQFLWLRNQAALLEGVADEFVWMQAGRLWSARLALPRTRHERGSDESFWSITLATLTKDIRLEWRSKDALNAMLFFSLLVVVIFVFSFDPLAEESRHIVGGLVWVAFLFAAVVALTRPGRANCAIRCSTPTRFSSLGECTVSGEGAGQLYLCQPAGTLMTPLFIIFYNLRLWVRRGS